MTAEEENVNLKCVNCSANAYVKAFYLTENKRENDLFL